MPCRRGERQVGGGAFDHLIATSVRRDDECRSGGVEAVGHTLATSMFRARVGADHVDEPCLAGPVMFWLLM